MHKIKIKDKQHFTITLTIVASILLAIVLLFSDVIRGKTNDAHVSNAASGTYNNQQNSNKGIYINDYDLGIKLCLPSKWEGNYTREKGKNCVKFYHAKTYDETKKGLIFTVYLDKTSNVHSKLGSYTKLPNFKEVSNKDGFSICISYPSASSKAESSYAKDYSQMINDVKDTIISTITFIK